MSEEIPGKTTIDSMLEYVNANGKSDVNTIASVLGTYPGIIEDWAKILESGGLVKITNELGKMFVAPAGSIPSQNVAESELLTIQKAKISQSTEYQRLREEQLKAKISELYKEAQVLDKEFMRKFPDLHKAVSELDSLFSKAEKMEKQLKAIQKKSESEKSAAITKFDYEYKRLEEISAKSVDIEKITQLAEDAKRFENVIQDLQVNKKKELAAVRKDIDDQVVMLKKTLDSAEREIDAEIGRMSNNIRVELQNLNEWNAIAKSASKDLPKTIAESRAAMKRLSDMKVKVDSEYTSINKSLDQLNAEYIKKAQPLFDQIEQMNQKISANQSLSRTIISANAELKGASEEIAKIQKEISSVENELKRVNTSTAKTAKNSKFTSLSKVETKSNDIKERLDKLKDKVEDVTKSLSSSNLINEVKKGE